jgi:hypothetical protein
MLAAFNEEPLSPESLKQLENMANDLNWPCFQGEDLPLVSKELLLSKFEKDNVNLKAV